MSVPGFFSDALSRPEYEYVQIQMFWRFCSWHSFNASLSPECWHLLGFGFKVRSLLCGCFMFLSSTSSVLSDVKGQNNYHGEVYGYLHL